MALARPMMLEPPTTRIVLSFPNDSPPSNGSGNPNPSGEYKAASTVFIATGSVAASSSVMLTGILDVR